MTRQEGGLASLELALLTPALLALLLFVAAAGRLASIRGHVDSAARDAARAGTLARSPGTASGDAIAAAEVRLLAAGVECRPLTVEVDTAEFRAGGQVASTITCVVDLGDLILLGVAGARVITAEAVEPVDTFRGLQP